MQRGDTELRDDEAQSADPNPGYAPRGGAPDAERHYDEAVRQAAEHNFRAISVFAVRRLEDIQRAG